MKQTRSQHNLHTKSYSRASRIRGRRLVAIWLAAALLYLPLSQSLKAGEATGMRPSGEITTRGVSRVDGASAISGETIFSGSSIATEQNASATIHLGRLGRLELLSNSGIRINFSETGIAASLAAGGVGVSLPAGVPGTVTTDEASVIASGDESTLFVVTIKDDATMVTAQTGEVQLRAFGRTQIVGAGERASISRHGLSLDTSQQQPGGQQNNLSGRKKGGIFLALGGAIAILLIVLIKHNDNNNNQSGCVTILSGITDPRCF